MNNDQMLAVIFGMAVSCILLIGGIIWFVVKAML